MYNIWYVWVYILFKFLKDQNGFLDFFRPWIINWRNRNKFDKLDRYRSNFQMWAHKQNKWSSTSGWPDFRLMDDCLIWAVFWKLQKYPTFLGYFSHSKEYDPLNKLLYFIIRNSQYLSNTYIVGCNNKLKHLLNPRVMETRILVV
jgi:hypothetical protein